MKDIDINELKKYITSINEAASSLTKGGGGPDVDWPGGVKPFTFDL